MKQLRKSSTDKKICGVCAGLGEYINLDPTIVRLLAVVLGIISCGTALLVYIVACIIMPD